MRRSSRRFGTAVACALVLALGSAGAAAAAAPTVRGAGPASERGVVQSVSAGGLVLKTLDGSTVAVAVDARTRVLVDDKPASILDVRPGFVAVVSFRGASGKPALEVAAYTASSSGTAGVKPVAGIVRSISPSELVLVSLVGVTIRYGVDAQTRVLVDGKLASVLSVRPGFVVVVRPGAASATGTRAAHRVYAFAPSSERGAHLYSGSVASVSTQAIVLRGRGGTFRVALAAKTRVFVDGTAASIGDVRPGNVAVVRTGSRREVWAFGAG